MGYLSRDVVGRYSRLFVGIRGIWLGFLSRGGVGVYVCVTCVGLVAMYFEGICRAGSFAWYFFVECGEFCRWWVICVKEG